MTMAMRLPALLLAAALALAGVLLPTTVHAGAGDLDRSFGQSGHRDLGRLSDPVMERVSGGRIVVAGSRPDGAVSVQLVSPGGDRVRSFGRRGTRLLGRGGSNSRVSLTWNWKRKLIIVAAQHPVGGTPYMRLWALRPDGSLATSFGDGGTATHGPGVWNDVQAQNLKLVVLGTTAVARLRADGLTFDQTFNGGTGITSFGEPELELQEIDQHRKGFFVSGASRDGLEVFRLSDNGQRDTSWGDGTGSSTWSAPPPSGYTTTGYAGGLTDIRGRDGALVYSGTIEASYPGQPGTYLFDVMGALKPDGYLAGSFRNAIPAGYSPGGAPVAIGRGKVLVPGSVFTQRRTAAAVVRLRKDGTLDRRFGTRGSFLDPRRNTYDTTDLLAPLRGRVVGLQQRYVEGSGSEFSLVGVQG